MTNNKYFGVIYKVINLINNKIYIGQTVQPMSKRIKSHYIEAKRSGFYFHRALLKYKKKDFKWEIIEKCNSKEELDEMEFHYIKQYNSLRPNGYNLTLGGDGMVGFKFSEESKERMSRVRKGRKMAESSRLKLIKNHADFSGKNNPMYGTVSPMRGKKHSEETKIKISLKGKGRKFTKEHKQKLSEAKKEYWRLKNEK